MLYYAVLYSYCTFLINEVLYTIVYIECIYMVISIMCYYNNITLLHRVHPVLQKSASTMTYFYESLLTVIRMEFPYHLPCNNAFTYQLWFPLSCFCILQNDM